MGIVEHVKHRTDCLIADGLVIGHKLALMHHTCNLAIACATGVTTLVVTRQGCKLGILLFFEGSDGEALLCEDDGLQGKSPWPARVDPCTERSSGRVDEALGNTCLVIRLDALTLDVVQGILLLALDAVGVAACFLSCLNLCIVTLLYSCLHQVVTCGDKTRETVHQIACL